MSPLGYFLKVPLYSFYADNLAYAEISSPSFAKAVQVTAKCLSSSSVPPSLVNELDHLQIM